MAVCKTDIIQLAMRMMLFIVLGLSLFSYGHCQTNGNCDTKLLATMRKLLDGQQALQTDVSDLKTTIKAMDMSGSICSRVVDCRNLYELGTTKDGVYTINPDGTVPFDAFCDMTNGGWTVFQRRIDNTVDFYRGWSEYVAGFGDLTGNLWAGLDKLHSMTSLYETELVVVMETFESESAEAHYGNFSVGDASTDYVLSVSGYRGTAGDALARHNGQKFSTFDRDNDPHSWNCALVFKGAWWQSDCHDSNLNGQYLSGVHASFADGINWKQFKGYNYSLKTTVMKLRRK